MTEDEKVGYDFEQAPGDGEGQGSLVCCSPRDHRVRHNWETKQQHTFLYEIQEQARVIHGVKVQKSSYSLYWTKRGMGQLLGGAVNVLYLHLMAITQIHTYMKVHWVQHLRFMSSYILKLYLGIKIDNEERIEYSVVVETIESESYITQSCPTLCNPMDCSLPGSSIYGIFQAKVLQWVAISFSRGSSQLRNRTRVSLIVGRRFTILATKEIETVSNSWSKNYF